MWQMLQRLKYVSASLSKEDALAEVECAAIRSPAALKDAVKNTDKVTLNK